MSSRPGFHLLFKRSPPRREQREIEEMIATLASRALAIVDLPDRKLFLEREIEQGFHFRRVEILLKPEGPERYASESIRVRNLLARTLGILSGSGKPFLSSVIAKELGVAAILEPLGGTHAFPIQHGTETLGLLILDTSPQAQLPRYTETKLLDLCRQIDVVFENSDLLRKKLELERALATHAQMVQLGEMTARIAHEIKNPLSSIKTIIQVMCEDRSLQPGYKQDLELINREIDRLSDSVGQLLSFSRPTPDPGGIVSLRDEAESVMLFLERDIQNAGVVVANEIPRELSAARGTPSAFREIFMNLVLNSIQAGGKGTHISLSAWEGVLEDGSERFVLLLVEDDGPGIPEETQAKVFAPFFTTKLRGTGLGLAIVKRNVEQLGGRIALESPARNGKGTRFLIHLPVAAR
jgi:signal transduction histidine kinase